MRRTDDGTALVEFVWLSLVLLVPLLYVLLAVFEVQRTAYAASAAARSAGRAFLTSPDEGSARARARVAADLAFRDQRLPGRAGLEITCRPRPDNCLSPGSVVTVRVRTSADLPLMPAIFGDEAPSIAVSSEHSAPYGTFRDDR